MLCEFFVAQRYLGFLRVKVIEMVYNEEIVRVYSVGIETRSK